VSGVGQALAGFIVDRVGGFRVLAGGVTLLASGAMLLSTAQGYGMLLAGAATMGLGNSVFHPADFTLLNKRVSATRLGHAFSVHGLTGSLGWAAAPVFVIALANAWSWRAAAFGAGVVGFAVLVFLFANRGLLADTRPAAAAERPARKGGSFGFLGVGVVWLCFAFFFVAVMAFGGLQNFAPPIFERAYGVSLAFGASGLTAYLLGSAAGTGAGGFFASKGDRQDRLIGIALGAAAVGDDGLRRRLHRPFARHPRAPRGDEHLRKQRVRPDLRLRVFGHR
jgi:MFS transporter, FSR family, fosmidomycin resistance protein